MDEKVKKCENCGAVDEQIQHVSITSLGVVALCNLCYIEWKRKNIVEGIEVPSDNIRKMLGI